MYSSARFDNIELEDCDFGKTSTLGSKNVILFNFFFSDVVLFCCSFVVVKFSWTNVRFCSFTVEFGVGGEGSLVMDVNMRVKRFSR